MQVSKCIVVIEVALLLLNLQALNCDGGRKLYPKARPYAQKRRRLRSIARSMSSSLDCIHAKETIGSISKLCHFSMK